jgi:hypothetical protein
MFLCTDTGHNISPHVRVLFTDWMCAVGFNSSLMAGEFMTKGGSHGADYRLDRQGRHGVIRDVTSGVTKCFPVRDNGDDIYNKVRVKEDRTVKSYR